MSRTTPSWPMLSCANESPNPLNTTLRVRLVQPGVGQYRTVRHQFAISDHTYRSPSGDGAHQRNMPRDGRHLSQTRPRNRLTPPFGSRQRRRRSGDGVAQRRPSGSRTPPTRHRPENSFNAEDFWVSTMVVVGLVPTRPAHTLSGLVTPGTSTTLLDEPTLADHACKRNGRHELTARNRVHLSPVWRGRRRRHRRRLPLRTARHRSDDHRRPPGRGTDRHRLGGLTASDGDESLVASSQGRRLAQVHLWEALSEHLMPVERRGALRTLDHAGRHDRRRYVSRHGRLWTVTIAATLMTPAHRNVFDTERQRL
jgi:hypothetical protein